MLANLPGLDYERKGMSYCFIIIPHVAGRELRTGLAAAHPYIRGNSQTLLPRGFPRSWPTSRLLLQNRKDSEPSVMWVRSRCCFQKRGEEPHCHIRSLPCPIETTEQSIKWSTKKITQIAFLGVLAEYFTNTNWLFTIPEMKIPRECSSGLHVHVWQRPPLPCGYCLLTSRKAGRAPGLSH